MKISCKFFVYVAMMHTENIQVVTEATLGFAKLSAVIQEGLKDYHKWRGGLKKTAVTSLTLMGEARRTPPPDEAMSGAPDCSLTIASGMEGIRWRRSLVCHARV